MCTRLDTLAKEIRESEQLLTATVDSVLVLLGKVHQDIIKNDNLWREVQGEIDLERETLELSLSSDGKFEQSYGVADKTAHKARIESLQRGVIILTSAMGRSQLMIEFCDDVS